MSCAVLLSLPNLVPSTTKKKEMMKLLMAPHSTTKTMGRRTRTFLATLTRTRMRMEATLPRVTLTRMRTKMLVALRGATKTTRKPATRAMRMSTKSTMLLTARRLPTSTPRLVPRTWTRTTVSASPTASRRDSAHLTPPSPLALPRATAAASMLRRRPLPPSFPRARMTSRTPSGSRGPSTASALRSSRTWTRQRSTALAHTFCTLRMGRTCSLSFFTTLVSRAPRRW
mmetsp:Transcript_19103/g.54693  ORF Transcript_19103/g.54693 Transcript_19103/m.54693 type:complete len:228 (-) Transcript_19103:181-864(-)